jgi:outer membrane protein TolC
MNRFESDSTSAILNPSYTSDVAASISQPLLRGGGIDVNAQPIRIAFYGYQRAQANTKAQVIRVLAAVDRVYWRLYSAREDVRVRRQQYDLAIAQLDRARRSVRVGQLAEVEIVRAQSGVADQVEAIITSENLLRDRERELKQIINSPDYPIGSSVALIPATEPKPMYFELYPEELAAKAMDQRMELLETELQIAQETANVRVARHEMLPVASLDYTYNINGLGESWNDSFDQVGDNRFADHRAGLQIEIPIGNEVQRSRLRQALLRRLQQLATREQRILQIRQEVYRATDELEATWQRVLAARQRVTLARRLLDVEIRQFEQGLRTSTEVLEAQTNLANAELSEISALADHQIAQVDIAFATGTVLGASNIVWDPTPSPKP